METGLRCIFTFSLCVVSWFLIQGGQFAEAATVCPGIESSAEVSPDWTENEKLMLCGKSSLSQTKFQAWSEIPLSQAAIHLRAFLQSRAYLNPKIQIQGEKLVFDPGPKVRVSKLDSTGAPASLDLSRRRNVMDQPLTPTLLSDLENWVQEELQAQGYPCPRVKALAQAETGHVLVQIDAGEKRSFGPVFLVPSSEFDPSNLTRFYPFSPDQTYDLHLLQVAEDRTLTEGTVEQTKFIPNCLAQPENLHQLYVLGPPRILSFSFLLSTEVLAQVNASYRRTRLDEAASFFDLGLQVSARLQQLTSYYQWYFSGVGDTQSLRPWIGIRRQDEHPFAMDSELAQVFYLNRWDTEKGFGISLGLGPQLEFDQMRRGPLDGESRRSLSLQGDLDLQSYKHELYRRNIYEGYRVRIRAGTQSESVLSDFTADTVKVDSEVLANLTQDSPPSWMGAWRLTAATTSSPTPEKLPPSDRQYLGGIETLRGFERFQLPAANEGALTRLSTSLEIRSAHWSDTLWPLAFVDFGWLGSQAYQIQGPTYRSPGLGLHWKSPIGPLRATLAYGEGRGDITDPGKEYGQWQIYASLGERF